MQIGVFIIGDEILSARRQDEHFQHAIGVLAQRDLELAWARYAGDDEIILKQQFAQIRALGDLCFSFGGIGATPDDKTRQAVAAAFGLRVVRHAQAVREIEAQFAAAAYPNRILMADLPEGAELIPNPINRIPGFSMEHIHCLPGFPEMAWPMMQWVLDHHYPQLVGESAVQLRLVVHDASESDILELMQDIQANYRHIKLSSLPKFLPDNKREIEMGIKGKEAQVCEAFTQLKSKLLARNFKFTEVR